MQLIRAITITIGTARHFLRGVIGGGSLLLVSAGLLSLSFPVASSGGNASGNTNTAASINSAVSGLSQNKFCSLIRQFSEKYRKVEDHRGNEVEASDVRYARKQALRTYLTGGRILAWSGTLEMLTTDRFGTANILVFVNCGAPGSTNEKIRMFNGAGLARGTDLYSNLAKMHEGTRIIFSGSMKVSGTEGGPDYIDEDSLTEKGSMTDPTFRFLFTEIAPQK